MRNKWNGIALLIPIILLSAAACAPEESVEQPADVDDLSMETEEESYPPKTDQVTVLLTNDTGEDYYYGVEFRVDRNVNGEWEKVPFEEEMYFIQIAIDLPAGEQTEEEIDLTLFEEYLEPAEYRVVKQVNGQELYAPFLIE